MIKNKKNNEKNNGLVRDLNPGPLAPKARIIPLDQRATCFNSDLNFKLYILSIYSIANVYPKKRDLISYYLISSTFTATQRVVFV